MPNLKISTLASSRFVSARPAAGVTTVTPQQTIAVKAVAANKISTVAVREVAIRNFKAEVRTRGLSEAVSLPVYSEASCHSFDDRLITNRKWYLPEYEFVLPGAPFFEIHSSNSFDGEGDELFKANVSLDFREVENATGRRQLENLRATRPTLEINKVNVTLIACDLVINWENKAKRFHIRGRLESNKAIFEFEDKDNFSAVRTAFRNMADVKGNDEEFAELIIYGNFVAYTRLKGIYTDDSNYTKQAISYATDPLPIRIRCNTADGTLYKLTTDNVIKPLGCLPPWKKEFIDGCFYRKININFDKAEIYQSAVQPECFYIFPKKYLLDRDDADGYKPTVDLLAQLNPDLGKEAENVIVLKFYIKPDLSLYDLRTLERSLQPMCPLTTLGSMFPVVKFPNEFEKNLSGSNLFKAREEPLISSSSNGYTLSFILEDPADLVKAGGLIPQTLKTQAGYQRELTYEIDERNKVKSTFQLSFCQTTGILLRAAIDQSAKKVVVTNLSSCNVTIRDLFFYSERRFEFENCRLSSNIILGGNQQADIPYDVLSLGNPTQLDGFENVEVNYAINESVEDNIRESRISVDCLRQTIVIRTNIKPSLHNISRIEVHGNIKILNMSLTSVLKPENDEFNPLFSPNFNLVLAMSEHLRAIENQVMDYTIQFHFNDNTMKETNPKVINFGTSPAIFFASEDIPT